MSGSTPLHSAARAGKIELAKLLLDNGAEPTVVNKKGATPLHFAIGQGNYDISTLLIQRGAKISAEDNAGISPLDAAVKSSNTYLVQMLIDKGADMTGSNAGSPSALHIAAVSGSVEVAKMLLNRGASVDSQSESGFTPLYLACENNRVDLRKFLIDRGASVDARRDNGRTPLHAACKNGAADAAKILIESGAKVSVEDNDGYTPLHLDSEFGDIETVELLLDKGANTTHFTKGSLWASLHTAARGGIPDILGTLTAYADEVDILLDAGDVEGMTALLDKNALSDVKDYFGAGPLIAASRAGQLQAVELLLATDREECIKYADNSGHTAVWWAARSGNYNLFQAFRQHAKKTGIKIWRTDVINEHDVGKTLLTYEAGFCFCDICTLSIPWGNCPRVCTVCYGGRFAICDDCFEAGFSCLEASRRPDTWAHSDEHCDCGQHYPYTESFIPRPDLAPNRHRLFD